ncbi:diiron oxygenase [Speluncibacter jeojiensis]|uniref:Diiron oxygenase n=1 Tax=Speluncibacter jeojiensis TaxID=2710754 RepID=A0A9X4LYS3_9ACTN|nr:diiron oxygenase [Corynebacteriales bacterium D3-21]
MTHTIRHGPPAVHAATTSPSTTVPDRDTVATRLLAGSVTRSYQPIVDIDWDAGLDPEKFFLPPQLLSLYDTPMWHTMSESERIELSRQELANVLSVGIWFENILNQALLRSLLHDDPTARHPHYALTEIGDETRHMIMFGRAIDTAGARPFRLRGWRLLVVNVLPHTFRGSLLWVSALIGEEIFDSLQRRMMADPQLQPMIARLMRIHVTEESRHIRFAREGVRRRMQHAGHLERLIVGNVNGLGGLLMYHLFTHRGIYARAGLDPVEAQRQARANENFRRARLMGFAGLGRFLDDSGLMGPLARRGWRRGGFLD